MSLSNSEKLQNTKEELQQEIDKVESLMDGSLGKVKTDLSSADPREIIKRNPLPAVGVAVLAGFLLSKKSFGKKKKNRPVKKGDTGTAVWNEVKRRAIRIGVSKAADYVEDLLDDVNIGKK